MPFTLQNLQAVQLVRRYALIFSACLVVACLIVMKPVYTEDGYHVWLEASGLFAIIVAIGLRMWCSLYIGGRKNAVLMTEGPYSISRNPLYVGSILAAFGIGLQTGMLTVAIPVTLVCALIFSIVVRREERFLLSTFGPAYANYCKRTPRFFPNFASYHEGEDLLVFDPARLRRTLRDGMVLFIAWPLTEIIESLHEQGKLPALLTLF